MPHLRRQPNYDLPQGPAPSLRTQFQTPPARHTPTNPTHRFYPSSGPHEITPDPLPVMAPPSGYPNPFNIFGRGRAQHPPPPEVVDVEDEFDDADEDYDANAEGMELGEYDDGVVGEELELEEDINDTGDMDGEEIDEEIMESQLEGDEEMHDQERSPSPLPPNLREISSLASWTVSTSKPGCGVAALRNPSPQQYWQSDGPQPHTLTLHFFKLVAIVRIRVYLDFELDESYTPTKMIFLAGMGGNDLVEFATWEGDGPCGWVDVRLEGVGGRNGGWVRENLFQKERAAKNARRKSQKHDDDNSEPSDTEALDGVDPIGDELDPYCGNVLKAMVIQVRVMENHQNGKDTHVRGFQVFACDESRRRVAAAPSASADAGHRNHRRYSARQSLRGGFTGEAHHARIASMASEDLDTSRLGAASGLDEPDWMGEPIIR